MAAKQEISYFGSDSLDSRFGSSSTSLATGRAGHELAWWERKIDEEARKQQRVIAEQTIKTKFGMERVGEIQQHGYQVFDNTLDYIMTVKQQTRTKEHQAIVNEFTAMTVNGLGNHMLSAMDAGATNIAVEIHRPLYPLPDPPERKSWLKRHFG